MMGGQELRAAHQALLKAGRAAWRQGSEQKGRRGGESWTLEP